MKSGLSGANVISALNTCAVQQLGMEQKSSTGIRRRS